MLCRCRCLALHGIVKREFTKMAAPLRAARHFAMLTLLPAAIFFMRAIAARYAYTCQRSYFARLSSASEALVIRSTVIDFIIVDGRCMRARCCRRRHFVYVTLF